MSKTALHNLRLIIPGIFLFIILITILQKNKGFIDIELSTDSLLYIVVVFGFGVIYYTTKLRYRVMKKALIEIDENIKDKLLLPYSNDSKIQKSVSKLRVGKQLLNVFYSLVDNEESLKVRAEEVYLNGLIWSTLADLLVICPAGILIYLVTYIITKENRLLMLACICLLVFIIAKILYPHIIKNHLSLSDYQLSYIAQQKKDELHKKLLQIS
jgi:hypothetical protein